MANVVIKSYQNGLKIFLDENASFDDILKEINDKFEESKKFFKNSKIAVSFEGRSLSKEEEIALVSAMENSGELNIVYIIGKDVETNEYFQKALEHAIQGEDNAASFGKLYCNSLRKGEHLEAESGVIILGDVEPGASICANGSIIILGGLYGSAVCTVKENEDKFFIAAMDVSCERLKIGSKKYFSLEKSKWLIKPKMQGKIAYINNNEILLENISSDTLKKICGNFLIK